MYFVLKRVSRLVFTAFAAALLLTTQGCNQSSNGTAPRSERVVNILAWVGYDEQDFVTRLEQASKAKVTVRTYVGGDNMYSMFNSAPPGAYDIVIVDQEYGSLLFEKGKIVEVPHDYWSSAQRLSPFANKTIAQSAGKKYAIPVRWGALGLVYNSDKLSDADVSSYDVLFSSKPKGRIGIFDWWLPNMAVFAKYLSVKNGWHTDSSFALTREQLSQLRELMGHLRPQIRSVLPSTGDLISSFRSGAVWLAPGVGEWAAATLDAEGLPITWTVPKEGGVMWIEAAAVTNPAVTRDEVKRVFLALQDPAVNASLIWRQAYVSQSPIRESYNFIIENLVRILKAQDISGLER